VDDADFLLQRALERALQERHPGRFVPHYTMVSFMRIPYAQALERSEIQRELLVEATRGLTSLDQIHWEHLDAQVLLRLDVLEDLPTRGAAR
jgi:kynurenine 3-monooxygenase